MDELPTPPPRKLKNAPRWCITCGKRESDTVYLWRCVACKKSLYCSKNCQKVDYPIHAALICVDTTTYKKDESEKK